MWCLLICKWWLWVIVRWKFIMMGLRLIVVFWFWIMCCVCLLILIYVVLLSWLLRKVVIGWLVYRWLCWKWVNWFRWWFWLFVIVWWCRNWLISCFFIWWWLRGWSLWCRFLIRMWSSFFVVLGEKKEVFNECLYGVLVGFWCWGECVYCVWLFVVWIVVFGGVYIRWLWFVWWCCFVMVVFCVGGFWGGYWFWCVGVVVLGVGCGGWWWSGCVVCFVVLVCWVLVWSVGWFGSVVGYFVDWVGIVCGEFVMNNFECLLFEMYKLIIGYLWGGLVVLICFCYLFIFVVVLVGIIVGVFFGEYWVIVVFGLIGLFFLFLLWVLWVFREREWVFFGWMDGWCWNWFKWLSVGSLNCIISLLLICVVVGLLVWKFCCVGVIWCLDYCYWVSFCLWLNCLVWCLKLVFGCWVKFVVRCVIGECWYGDCFGWLLMFWWVKWDWILMGG